MAPQVELRDAVFEVRDIESQSPELDSGLGFLGYAQSGGSRGHPYLAGTVDVDSLLSPYCVERYGPNSRVLTMEEVIFQTVGNLPPGVSGIVDEFHNNGYVFLSSWDNEFAKTGSGCGYCSYVSEQQHGHAWPKSWNQLNAGCIEGVIACGRDHGLSDVRATYALPLAVDDIPKWTHLTLVVGELGLQVLVDGVEVGGEATEGTLSRAFAAFDFAGAMKLGHLSSSDPGSNYRHFHLPLYGSVAMLRMYDKSMTASEIACEHEHTHQMLLAGRLSVTETCNDHTSRRTGCSSAFALNGDDAEAVSVDDGSCEYRRTDIMLVETGTILSNKTGLLCTCRKLIQIQWYCWLCRPGMAQTQLLQRCDISETLVASGRFRLGSSMPTATTRTKVAMTSPGLLWKRG